VDGEVTFEYEIAAVFDLGNRVETRKVYSLALLGGELRPQDKGPIVEPFTDDGGVQFVCSRLQCGNVINSQEREALPPAAAGPLQNPSKKLRFSGHVFCRGAFILQSLLSKRRFPRASYSR
jgi:hypothetical protein